VSALLELDDVEARYGPVQALHGITLEVAEGEVVAVLGANGAGKTTTLRAISGTVRRSGRIAFGGKPLRGGPEAVARSGIAHVPEGRGTFTELTVLENLRLGAYTRRERSVKADVDRVAQWFPWIRERSGQQAGTLSGGEQQMLSLARGMATDPALLLLDELSMGLAPMIVEELYGLVAQIAATGVSILVVEQFARTVLGAADYAAIMVHGRIAKVGRPSDLEAELSAAYLGA